MTSRVKTPKAARRQSKVEIAESARQAALAAFCDFNRRQKVARAEYVARTGWCGNCLGRGFDEYHGLCGMCAGTGNADMLGAVCADTMVPMHDVNVVFAAWTARLQQLADIDDLAADALEAARDRQNNPAKGTDVKVIRGRKVPLGTIGRVFWIGDGDCGRRVGLQTAAGETFYTSIDNIDPV